MLITDILIRSNRRCTDAYCHGQRSECVAAYSASWDTHHLVQFRCQRAPLFNLIQTTPLYWAFALPIAMLDNCMCLVRVCVCIVCLSVLWFMQESLVSLHSCMSLWLCVCIVCVCASQQHAFAFPKAGGFLCLQQQYTQSLKCSRANAAQMWPRFLALLLVKYLMVGRCCWEEKKVEMMKYLWLLWFVTFHNYMHHFCCE